MRPGEPQPGLFSGVRGQGYLWHGGPAGDWSMESCPEGRAQRVTETSQLAGERKGLILSLEGSGRGPAESWDT